MASSEQIQQILDENAHIIKVIIACQNEGRVTDALLYQTRLQLNIAHLASIADNHPHPSTNSLISNLQREHKTSEKTLSINKFVSLVQKFGFKNLSQLAAESGIEIEKIPQLSLAYLEFLRRQNKVQDANRLQIELELQGIKPQ